MAGSEVPHLPRIRCGRAVLCRERWRIPLAELTAWKPPYRRPDIPDVANFVAATHLAERYGLPPQVFVKYSSQPKPIFVDWASPLLVRQFFRLAHSATGMVEISEMLPRTDQCWLTIDGQTHTSELRCTVFSR